MRIANLALTALMAGALGMAGCSSTSTDTPLAAIPTYNAETFYQTTSYGMGVAGGAFSPDGKSLLVSSDQSGIFNAYSLDLASNKMTALTRSGKDSTFAVSYLPDGKRFLFTADNGGNELNHLYVGEPGQSSVDLTPGDKVKAAFVSWLADKSAFFVMTNERDARFFDLYRYDANDFSRKRVVTNDIGMSGFTVSRDGRYAATVISTSGTDNDIYLVDLASDSSRNITNNPEEVSHSVYSFAPDGTSLLFGSDQGNEFIQPYRYKLGNGEVSKLFSSDWDVNFVGFSPSGRYRIQSINADAVSQVSIVERSSGKKISLPKALPAGQIRSIRFAPGEKKIALMLNSDRSPSNIYTFDLGGMQVAQHTQAFTGNIDPDVLVSSEVVRYESYDGLEIPSILYKPKMASSKHKVPALIFVHGGPGGQSRVGYSAVIQHLVNHGYAVLAANNRGSSGYGRTFFHADDLKHGEADLDDIVEGKRYLQSLDWVDGDKIGIMGGSYGGYMTMAALAFRPEVFNVGINIFGVTNWYRTLTSIPPWWESFRATLYSELGDPAVHGERLKRISPLFHATNITKPVLIVQGANDPRVLQIESDEMVEAVEANNVSVKYVLFPDEGHGFTKKQNRITASDAYLTFLQKYMPVKD